MGNDLLASKVLVIEESPRVRAAPSSPTSILGAVGVAERGPIGQPVLVTSWDEYLATFGSFVAGADLPTAMYSFFKNGGGSAYVVRTVHYTDVSTSAAHGATFGSVDLGDVVVRGLTEGSYANSLKARISDANSGDPTEFNLALVKAGAVVESYSNLSVAAGHDRNAASVVNSLSDLIFVTVEGSTRPPNTSSDAALTGGSDGLIGLGDADFIGSSASGAGIYALEQVSDISLLIVPGISAAASHQAIVSYCEIYRGGDCFPILDCPANTAANAMITQIRDDANALYNVSEFGAMYWPRYKISNPSKAVFGGTPKITVPASGGIAGVYARNDGRRPGGVYTAPAGVENGVLLDAVELERAEVMREAVRDLVYPKRINPICSFPGVPVHLDGSRTLKGNGSFPSIPERRGVIKIIRDLKSLLVPFKHKPNTADLRDAIRRSIDSYLALQTKDGAFVSTDPSQAYFVDVSDTLNTPAVIAQNKVIIRVGVATAKPAEFIVLYISQDPRALEIGLNPVNNGTGSGGGSGGGGTDPEEPGDGGGDEGLLLHFKLDEPDAMDHAVDSAGGNDPIMSKGEFDGDGAEPAAPVSNAVIGGGRAGHGYPAGFQDYLTNCTIADWHGDLTVSFYASFKGPRNMIFSLSGDNEFTIETLNTGKLIVWWKTQTDWFDTQLDALDYTFPIADPVHFTLRKKDKGGGLVDVQLYVGTTKIYEKINAGDLFINPAGAAPNEFKLWFNSLDASGWMDDLRVYKGYKDDAWIASRTALSDAWAPTTGPALPDLAVYYKFDETSDTAGVADEQGLISPLAYRAGTGTVTTVPGVIRNGSVGARRYGQGSSHSRFDGAWADPTGESMINLLRGEFTIDFYVKTFSGATTVGTVMPIEWYSGKSWDGQFSLEFKHQSSYTYFRVLYKNELGAMSAWEVAGPIPYLPTFAWNHFTLRKTNTGPGGTVSFELWINGVKYGGTFTAPNYTSGVSYPEPTAWFGTPAQAHAIDDLRVYRVAKDDAWIAARQAILNGQPTGMNVYQPEWLFSAQELTSNSDLFDAARGATTLLRTGTSLTWGQATPVAAAGAVTANAVGQYFSRSSRALDIHQPASFAAFCTVPADGSGTYPLVIYSGSQDFVTISFIGGNPVTTIQAHVQGSSSASVVTATLASCGLVAGQWCVIGVSTEVVDAGTNIQAKLYVNGVLRNIGNKVAKRSAQDIGMSFRVLGDRTGVARYSGKLAEVGHWKRELTEAEWATITAGSLNAPFTFGADEWIDP